MNTYLESVGNQLSDIQKLLKVDIDEFADMINIDKNIILNIMKSPQNMTRQIAMQVFIIANARAKFEQSEPIKALLALCFQIDELDTKKFMKKINKPYALITA